MPRTPNSQRANRPSAAAPAIAATIAMRMFRQAVHDTPAIAPLTSGSEWIVIRVADPSSLDDIGNVGCGGSSVCGVVGRVIAGCDGVGLNSTQPIVGKYTSGHANACCCVSLNVSPTSVDGSSTNPEATRAGMPSVRSITVIADA